MIKTSKKISALILLILMVIGVIGIGGAAKVAKYLNGRDNINDSYMSDNNDKSIREQDKSQLSEYQKELASINEAIAKEKDDEKLASLNSDKESIENHIKAMNIAIEKAIDMDADNYRCAALEKMMDYQDEIEEMKASSPNLSAEAQKTVSEKQALILRLEKVIDNKDLKEYTSIENEIIKNDKSLTNEEKQLQIDMNNLKLKINYTGGTPKNETDYEITNKLNIIRNYQNSLLTGMDMTGESYSKPLTPTRTKEIKNQIAVEIYKLEHKKGLSASDSGQSISQGASTLMVYFGIFMVAITMMVLAGSSVSQEMSTGSIKSLIISPTKRWKIFVSKYLSLLTVGIGATALLYAVYILAHGAFFGFGSGESYIYATNGVAHELNFYVYQLGYIFSSFLDILVFMTFAFMLSIVTRNTAVSVGASMGLSFGGIIVNAMINEAFRGERLGFLPFNNIGFATKFFPVAHTDMTGGIGEVINQTNSSVLFSLCYTAVMMICMIYTGLDSFNRRDIK